MKIKAEDNVVLLTGKYEEKYDDKGNVIVHKVIAASPKEGKVIVEGANVVHKHNKARRQGEVSSIVDTEGAIYACKVALYCPECKKGVRTHVETVDGKKVRVCSGKRDGKPCGHKFD